VITSINGVKVLVTGATGFIGSHLVRRLVSEGAEVYGIDKVIQKSPEKSAKLYQADLRDFDSILKLTGTIKPKKIFHLAAFLDTARTMDTIDDMVEINIRGTLNLVRALNVTDYDCLVNIGTSEEYGDNPVPFQEDQTPNPVSPYSASKAATTVFCRMLHKTLGLPIVTLRPFLTYGPGQEGNMLVPSLMKQIMRGKDFEMTDGLQTREFNYVADTVDGIIRAAITPAAVGEVINIGNGAEYQVKTVVQKIIKLMGSSIIPKYGALSHRPGEAMHFYCDNTKALQLLGWRSKVSLDEGLKITADWYKKRYKEGM
jgi:UDP-glucose 4-epimerase